MQEQKCCRPVTAGAASHRPAWTIRNVYNQGVRLTDSEWEALVDVAELGAVAHGRMRRKLGPAVNWEGVIERGLVKNYQGTPFGDVLGLTDRGRKVLKKLDPKEFGSIHYLASPGSVTDRAFGNEALHLLRSKGYSWADEEYKFHTLRGERQPSNQITRYQVRVPEEMMEDLEALPFQGHEFGKARRHAPTLGHPLLYATVSRGGANAARVEALSNEHEFDCTEWKHPLMIAVLRETQALREVVRRANHEHAKRLEGIRRHFPTSTHWEHDQVQLLIVPVP